MEYSLKQTVSIYISIYLHINLACLSGCLSVCLYPINVKTAEPIGPKFFEGSRVTPGKVYGWSNFQKFASLNFQVLKILKIHESEAPLKPSIYKEREIETNGRIIITELSNGEGLSMNHWKKIFWIIFENNFLNVHRTISNNQFMHGIICKMSETRL